MEAQRGHGAGARGDAGLEDAAQYAVAMAYRIRFVMQMNAREAMHLTELRSQPQGHPTYRRVAQQMHRADRAACTRRSARRSRYVDHEDVDLERLEAERRTEAKRNAPRSGLNREHYQPWCTPRWCRRPCTSCCRRERSAGFPGPGRCRSTCRWRTARSAGPSCPMATSIAIWVPVGHGAAGHPGQAVLDRLCGGDVEAVVRTARSRSAWTRRDSRCGGQLARHDPESGSGHRERWGVRWRSRCR